MSYSRNTLELHYRSFFLSPDQPLSTREFAASFTLLYPRPNLATRSSTRAVTPGDPAGEITTLPLGESLLFKETVQGPFALIIELSPGEERQGPAQLLQGLVREGSDAAGRLVSDPFAAALRPLLRAPFRFFGQLSPDLPLAAGQVDLKSGKTKKEKALVIPLIAERPWPRPAPPRRSKSNVPRQRRPLVESGAVVGEMHLTYRVV